MEFIMMPMDFQTLDPILPKDSAHLRLYRGRPGAIQDLQYRPGSLEIVLYWSAPQNMQGVDGWRVFQDNEGNLIQQIDDRNARQVTIKMPGNAKAMFYVCAVSEFKREGPKKGLLTQTNTDQVVVTGTAGATPGIPSAPDPTWRGQPSGGLYRPSTL
jgi:hypothetical protein